MTVPQSIPPRDSAEASAYNRIRRQLSIINAALGFLFLIVLLATGWSATLRSSASQLAHHNYALALFYYVFALLALNSLLGLGLDIFSFRLEHRFHLSNQKFAGWSA